MKHLGKSIAIGFIFICFFTLDGLSLEKGKTTKKTLLINDQSDVSERQLKDNDTGEFPNHTNKAEATDIKEKLNEMTTKIKRLDKELKGLDKQRGGLGTRIEELEKTDKSLWLPIAAIIIALFGGLPGIFAVVNHFYKRPKFSFHFVSWIQGKMVNSKKTKNIP